ncbi:nucleotide triphosphate diphosphatase NUDT15 [Asanoa iriomotensis]|uniref:MutT/nudix family protein n=1 Tax=Asanoa iriomotensis TaxID=234613 RepID=A0ABQ4BXQ3_9ACTN|nr:NUDIX hydrolase [Asanoa iriomotensis]GIF55260.1 putative MutT/nudix family protein [Asanoa iriomotensis]
MAQASSAAPTVGVGVFVFWNGTFLMGKRRGAHGAGTWSVPGGHPEFGESFEETAQREVQEETGVLIRNIRFGAVTNDLFDVEGKHYVTIWMLSDYRSGEPTITEPDKYDSQGWYDFSTLPDPLFLPWRQLLRSTFISDIRAQLESSDRARR